MTALNETPRSGAQVLKRLCKLASGPSARQGGIFRCLLPKRVMFLCDLLAWRDAGLTSIAASRFCPPAPKAIKISWRANVFLKYRHGGASRCTDRCILHDRLDLKETIRCHDIVIINKYDDVAPRFAD